MENNNQKTYVAIVALCILVLLFGGYIIYDKVLSSKNTNEDNNKTSEVDSTILDNLYTILGILPVDQYYRNSCLNQAISVNNYRDNAGSIFSWYASFYGLNTYHEDAKICVADGNICNISVYNAASARSI